MFVKPVLLKVIFIWSWRRAVCKLGEANAKLWALQYHAGLVFFFFIFFSIFNSFTIQFYYRNVALSPHLLENADFHSRYQEASLHNWTRLEVAKSAAFWGLCLHRVAESLGGNIQGFQVAPEGLHLIRKKSRNLSHALLLVALPSSWLSLCQQPGAKGPAGAAAAVLAPPLSTIRVH